LYCYPQCGSENGSIPMPAPTVHQPEVAADIPTARGLRGAVDGLSS